MEKSLYNWFPIEELGILRDAAERKSPFNSKSQEAAFKAQLKGDFSSIEPWYNRLSLSLSLSSIVRHDTHARRPVAMEDYT